jgi:Tfp pilus assembly protein FimT
VAVIGLVVVLLSLALGGYLAWSQTTALAAAEDAILSSLARAREHAISRRQQTTLVLTNAALVQTRSAACFIFAHDEDGRERPLGPTNALPAGIAFSNSLCASRFSFRPDGACADDGDWGNLTRRTVTLFHVGRRRQPLARNIEVDRLTGLARPLARGEEP